MTICILLPSSYNSEIRDLLIFVCLIKDWYWYRFVDKPNLFNCDFIMDGFLNSGFDEILCCHVVFAASNSNLRKNKSVCNALRFIISSSCECECEYEDKWGFTLDGDDEDDFKIGDGGMTGGGLRVCCFWWCWCFLFLLLLLLSFNLLLLSFVFNKFNFSFCCIETR